MSVDDSQIELNRREALTLTAGAVGTVLVPDWKLPPRRRQFRLWAFGDAHVGTDLVEGRRSLAIALEQSERGDEEGAVPFEWDLAINVGDMSGAHQSPTDEEGREVIAQYSVLKDHPREAVYDLCGNHDRNAVGEPEGAWFRRWIDPLGENPETSGVDVSRRPYPVEGTWERYQFRVGNLLFLMMSDRNEPTQTVGRGQLGGNPAGVVTGETFAWWKDQVLANPDSIVVSAHHYVLKDTTVASGDWEGFEKNEQGDWRPRFHGYYPQGSPRGASYLYWVNGQEDSGAFESFLAEHPQSVGLWLAGHTHAQPNARVGNKTHIETRWGTHFINVCALTRFHVKRSSRPMSRLLTFEEGSRLLRVQCYMHSNDFARRGWYARAERTLLLPKPFRWA